MVGAVWGHDDAGPGFWSAVKSGAAVPRNEPWDEQIAGLSVCPIFRFRWGLTGVLAVRATDGK